jgi:hypothetical protein
MLSGNTQSGREVASFLDKRYQNVQNRNFFLCQLQRYNNVSHVVINKAFFPKVHEPPTVKLPHQACPLGVSEDPTLVPSHPTTDIVHLSIGLPTFALMFGPKHQQSIPMVMDFDMVLNYK